MDKKQARNEARDMMWAFLEMGGQKANIPALKDSVFKLIEAVKQKDAGQRGKKSSVDWDELWIYQMTICCEATALVLSGELDKLETEGGTADD